MKNLTMGKNPNIDSSEFEQSNVDVEIEIPALVEVVINLDKLEAIKMEKAANQSIGRMIKTAQKMYDLNPAKRYYDFIVTLESAAKTLKV